VPPVPSLSIGIYSFPYSSKIPHICLGRVGPGPFLQVLKSVLRRFLVTTGCVGVRIFRISRSQVSDRV
jgi:hypothetical protein